MWGGGERNVAPSTEGERRWEVSLEIFACVTSAV
jgi:hypothetical protein